MKKIMFMTLGLILISTNVFAGFNFGVDTYKDVNKKLIVNSLGDEVTESKFNYKNVKLGYNDYIPENAFKNNLYNDGYTKVYDSKPNNIDVVEIGYMGLKGNPRSFDADYVLKEEWEKYSSQYQDVRIEKNKSRIDVNKTHIINNTKEIKNVDKKHTNWNNNQDKKITSNASNIKNNSKAISGNSRKINDVDNRVSELEETQYRVDAELQIYDAERWTFSAFVNNDVRHERVDAVGVKLKVKLGKDYAVKRMEELEKKIDEYIELKEQERTIVVPTKTGFKVERKW